MAGRRYKAVLSDGGNILFPDRRMKRQQYDLVSPHIPGLTYRDFQKGFRRFKTRAQTEPDYSIDDALRDYLESLGHQEVYARLSKAKIFQPALNNGVRETLGILSGKGVKFIILTDATKRGRDLLPFLERFRIADYVTDIISSKDIGVTKPDPCFFDTALRRHSLEKRDAIFLGHDKDELLGAHMQGFRVYSLNGEQELAWLPDPQKLQHFRDLEKIVLTEA